MLSKYILQFTFTFFILFMGSSRQEYWRGLPFSSPVNHALSELSTMTRPSWVALHCMAHSFIELDKAVVHVISLVSFLWLWFSFCLPLMDKDKRLMEASWWERLTEGKTGSCSDGQDHAQKIFNPIFYWWAGLCSLPVAWPEAKLWWRWWRQWWPPSKGPMRALLHSVPPTLQ